MWPKAAFPNFKPRWVRQAKGGEKPTIFSTCFRVLAESKRDLCIGIFFCLTKVIDEWHLFASFPCIPLSTKTSVSSIRQLIRVWFALCKKTIPTLAGAKWNKKLHQTSARQWERNVQYLILWKTTESNCESNVQIQFPETKFRWYWTKRRLLIFYGEFHNWQGKYAGSIWEEMLEPWWSLMLRSSVEIYLRHIIDVGNHFSPRTARGNAYNGSICAATKPAVRS